jgi:hypothetical protein
MQHGRQPDAGAKVLWVGRDRQERVGSGPEQQVVDHGLVVERDRRDRGRQRKHHMVVGHGQQVGLPLGKPGPCGLALTLRAVAVAAGVVGDRDMIAGLAARDMAAERRRAAGPDGRDDLALTEAQMPGMGAHVSVAMLVQDIGNLKGGTRHAPPSSGRR